MLDIGILTHVQGIQIPKSLKEAWNKDSSKSRHLLATTTIAYHYENRGFDSTTTPTRPEGNLNLLGSKV